jgi:drug/metabolite transporter (DMT)-like permease
MAPNFSLIAIGSAFFAAITNIWAKVVLRDIQAKNFLGINFLASAIILGVFSPLFFYFQASLLTFGLLILIALIDSVDNYYYFLTIEKSEVSVATPLLSLAPAFTFLFAWLFLQDMPSIRSLVASVVIIILVVVFSIDFTKFKEFRLATLQPAMMCSLLFGVSAIPSKYLLAQLHATNGLTLYMFRAVFISVFAFLLFKPNFKTITLNHYKHTFLRSIFVIITWGLLYWALTFSHAGVAITLANITPIFVFILGAIFLRERVTWKKAVTAGLIFIFVLFV